jgi:hypothetical protein
VSFFKAGSMILYPGDVMETEKVVEFLTSEEALELPDKIEEVDADNLFRFFPHFFHSIFLEHTLHEKSKNKHTIKSYFLEEG